MAGDAEILEQQVAGEQVGGGEFAQCLAVVDERGFGGGGVGLAQEQVEWPEAALDIAVFDDQVIAVDAATVGGVGKQVVG